MKSRVLFTIMGLMLVLFCYSSAQVPQMINYQGKLTKASGASLDTTISMVFTIYADSNGVTSLWTETQTAVAVQKGVFNVLLGSVNPIDYSVFDGNTRYLGVSVGGDPEITPRKAMVSVAYAMQAGAGGGGGGWVDDGTVVRLETITDYVGIGTSSPNEQLEITENLRLPSTTATTGIIKIGASTFIHSYGAGNTFVGQSAGNLTMTGSCNTVNGNRALYSNTTGGYNTANGRQALYSNTTGGNNIANGLQALFSNTEGDSNTAVGFKALYSNTTGYRNTANGFQALYSNTTGNSNTALGYGADVSANNLTNATAIGSEAVVDASNKVRIGNTSVGSIGGQVDWTTFSDGRYKKSVSQNVPGLAFISKLKPVTYTMDVDAIDAALNTSRKLLEGQSEQDLKPSADEIASKQAQAQIVYTGFIAQEVEQAAQETGYDFSGVDAPKNDKGMYGLRYAEFVVPLVKAVQEQQQMIQEQQQMIQELQKRIEELEEK